MLKKEKKIITAVLLTLLFAAVWPEKTAPDRVTAADMTGFVNRLFKKKHLAGSVAVVRNGHVQVISCGLARVRGRIKNGDRRILYPVASLQKEVTGAMIIQLMEEKKGSPAAFSEHTKISRWYPNLRDAGKITVGELMSHTSGFLLPEVEVDRHVNYSEARAISWLVNRLNQLPKDPVGTYHYSDVNYILLAGIIRKLTGKSYAWNFQQRVVRRLGLKSTCLGRPGKGRLLAESYCRKRGRDYQRPVSLTRSRLSQLVGAGNMLTTAGDFYTLQAALGTGEFLSPSAFYKQTHLKSKVNRYSGGLYLKKGGAVKLAYGAINGAHYAAYFQLTADNKNGIVMLLNERSGGENSVKSAGYKILQEIMFDTFSKS
ncbi:penicillin-binding protein [Lactobacillus nasalidis]|uniref:Penicillin-binding protein n=1 Tax=Lactobacillus nasalidis TaxID=2797258 RepID=A0ABQ3W486_9LACO|nr:serine hydrolase domain-containing protein [Lactobacillus nasalidis]GHV97689.1 penicillin-binding protein [Lactobacillus nasalidis]GHV99991.1 penicillin-binding protein [Lactobacillus nasalidis]GHW01313.1 penicillin-binding protein [Lactobacillus nasalidis]